MLSSIFLLVPWAMLVEVVGLAMLTRVRVVGGAHPTGPCVPWGGGPCPPFGYALRVSMRPLVVGRCAPLSWLGNVDAYAWCERVVM
jgi:hypothetical protein